MENSCVYAPTAAEFHSYSSPNSVHNIFSLKYSDLPSSRYSYFLQAFTDECDFEEFKRDLRNFQKLKKNCLALNNNNNNNNSAAYNQRKQEESDVELNEDLEIICRQNTARKARRKSSVRGSSQRNSQEEPSVHFGSCDSEHNTSQLTSSTPVKVNKDVVQEIQRSSSKSNDCPYPYGLRGDFDRRSSVFGYDRKSGLRSSINDILMEFINGDEHFREFDRVFETVNSRKNTRDRNGSISRRMSSHRERMKSPSSPDRLHSGEMAREGSEGATNSFNDIDDTFADFFDNDEDFLAFEKELEKFRARRLTRYYGSISSLGSSKDIFSDVKSYCDRSLNRSKTGSLLSVNSCSSSGEATPSCPTDGHGEHEVEWQSVEDWGKMFKKLRRNSRLFSDSKYQTNKCEHHRHSMYGLKKAAPGSEQYQKTQSLSDIPGHCTDSVPPSKSTHDEGEQGRMTTVMSSSVNRIPRITSADESSGPRKSAAADPNESDFSSCDIWSDSYVDGGDNHYSSSSTLCSNHDDSISFSPTCSCSSDLHINEDTDDDFNFSSSPSSRQRSQSLQTLTRSQLKSDRTVRTGSLKKRYSKGREPHPSEVLTSSQSQPSFHHLQYSCQQCQDGVLGHSCCPDSDPLHPAFPRGTSDVAGSVNFLLGSDRNERWDAESGGHLSCTSSSSSLHLTDDDAADDESDQFHSAKSDFSEHFHTAKSDFPSHRRQSGYLSERPLTAGHRSQSADLSGLGTLENTDRGSRVDAWLTSDLDPAGARNDCQYTCHQLCVPSVNLNCSIISDEGDDQPQPPAAAPERRGSLETSLSVGINARPGAAKVVSRGASEDGTRSTTPNRPSESEPDLQQICRNAGRSMPTSQPIIESLANALGYDSVDVSNLPKLPPPPSAIDELTVDNDDSRFITHGKQIRHRHSVPQTSGHPLLPEEDSHKESQIAGSSTGSAKIASSPSKLSTTHLTMPSLSPSMATTKASSTAASAQVQQHPLEPAASSPSQSEKTTDIETSSQTQTGQEGVKPEGEAHAEEKDETDSGYRSGTIPDDKLPKVPSQATLDRQDLKRKITKYNHFVPTVHLEMTDKESFQGFLKVCINLIRPITMELGARPPSIYEMLTKEHIIEENTQHVAFYMPRDTYKSLHVSSETTTKELVSLLLKKFHILDHPRKFAMYEQEFSDNNKLVRLRRLTDKDHPLRATLAWNPERFLNYRMVLQENETGEIVWDAFSYPELNNFLKVLDREEKETIMELKHKYAYMKQLMEKRLMEFRSGKRQSTTTTTTTKVKSTSQA